MHRVDLARMSEEREPDLDHVREAMREHDERQAEDERREEAERRDEAEEPAEERPEDDRDEE